MSLTAWDTDPVNANSYVTRAAADSYFDDALHASSWDGASGDTKDKALVTATRMLDRSRWGGSRTSTSQPLQWPRSGTTDRDGVDISDAVVPTEVREATYELALSLLDNTGLQEGKVRVNSISTGRTSVSFSAAPGGTYRLPNVVRELIRHLLAGPTDALAEGASFGTDPDDNPPHFEDIDEWDRSGAF